MKSPVSVIILTYNEELNLEACLKSVVDWAGEIFVVDSLSTDKTQAIAKRYGAQVVEHAFKNQAEQFNWALKNLKINNEWILRLDADEWVMPALAEDIQRVLPYVAEGVNGFYIKRRVYFMGRWIKHGGYYPIWILRLFRKGKGKSEEREMDEHLMLTEGRALRLKHDFVDENHRDLAWWTDKHNKFSSREVEFQLKAEKDALAGDLMGSQTERKRWIKDNIYMHMPLFWRAFAYFLLRYVILLGFLDGQEGLIFHFLQGCWHRFLIDAKLYEARHK